jgi:hypothetical protein
LDYNLLALQNEINITMKQTIEIPEGHELIQEGNTYKIVEKKNKYPMELKYTYIVGEKGVMSTNFFGTSELSKKYITFIALVETCKEWNRIDGFEADWSDDGYYCISDTYSEGLGVYCEVDPRVLHFKDEEAAELFLKTFRYKIELVKDLI